ncbi:MAG: hypothetical protein ACKN9T_07365, partial [Candidatus Methylumidiphilus sp.]
DAGATTAQPLPRSILSAALVHPLGTPTAASHTPLWHFTALPSRASFRTARRIRQVSHARA